MDKDYNSEENVVARKDQEDPIVMYLIVRESLGMSIGKTAAQCAHASQMLLLEYLDQKGQQECFGDMPSDPKDRVSTFEKWLDSSFRKVVLKADEKEWNNVLKEFSCLHNYIIVTDAGLTELAANTDTIIGVFPMYKSEVPKCIKKLQALK